MKTLDKRMQDLVREMGGAISSMDLTLNEDLRYTKEVNVNFFKKMFRQRNSRNRLNQEQSNFSLMKRIFVTNSLAPT